MVSPQLILFAIQAGVQLYGSMRKAYADGTRGRTLILPLPRSEGVDWTSAVEWFGGDGRDAAADYPRVAEIMDTSGPSEEDKEELVELYVAVRAVSEPQSMRDGSFRGQISADELSALVTVRQWSKGRYGPDPTGLQTVGGTLVNIGIDYFIQKPGAISDQSAEGRALRAFLTGLDKTDFATASVNEIAPGLMVAVLESVSASPELIRGGEKAQLLVQTVSNTLLRSTRDLLANAASEDRRKAGVWIQLVARSLIKGGAETVLSNQHQFFDVGDAESKLLGKVGATVTELLVGESKVTFEKLLSADGLNTVVKSALVAVAENPDLMKVNNDGLKSLLTGLADALSKKSDLVHPDIFPEFARLVLEKSAANLEVIWGGRTSNPGRNLLLTASKTLLSEISRKPPAGSTWKPKLGRQQLVETMELVADEVIDNPEWLIKRAGETDSNLGVATRAIFESLRKLDGRKVSAEAGIAILQAGIRAVALQSKLLNDVPGPAGAPARKAVSQALDGIFDIVFDEGADAAASWTVARSSALVAVTEIGLEELAMAGAGQEQLAGLREVMTTVMSGATVFDLNEFQRVLHDRLAV